MTIKELREKRAKLLADARVIIDLAETEKRAVTDDENAKWETLIGEHDKLSKEIDREERQREAERQVNETRESEERAADTARQAALPEQRDARIGAAFRGWLMSGTPGGDGAEEFRALSAGINTEGGYLVVPEEFVRRLIKNLDDLVFIRSRATVIPLAQAASAGIPSLDADPADADWTTELQTGSEDSTMTIGKREMRPHPMAKLIKVSNLLLRVSAIPAEQLVMDRMNYKFAITQEKAYLTGNGNQQPLGVFTASNDGIPTGRDFSEGNTTTQITFDGLLEAKYGLKAGYWKRASWLFHRDAVKQIAKLKDGEGQYLWRDSVREDEPDRLLGRPVDMSEYAPNTFTTGLYVGILGDFSNYWIVDSLAMQMQRLAELYAANNQVGFIGRYEGDGAPVLGEAFARVKLA